MRSTRPPRRPFVTCLLLIALASVAGCNLIETRQAHDAALSHMVPGPGAEPGKLDCWVTLEFKRYPKSGDLRDIEVRFDSIALTAPVAFDWKYIAANDKLTRREGYGSGLHEAEVTTAVQRPPLGRPTQVRFTLPARTTIVDAPATLYLEAELYWGGERQDTMRQTIEHIYASAPGPT